MKTQLLSNVFPPQIGGSGCFFCEIYSQLTREEYDVAAGDDVAGEGAYRREMEQLAVQLNSAAQFKGFQKNVDQWLAACDMVLVPSHAEPLGNATLEAMANARPVIGGNVGGIPEMIVDHETGLLVPAKSPGALAKAISSLLSDGAYRRQLGFAARARCETMFSLEAHVNAVLAEYETVLRRLTTGVRS